MALWQSPKYVEMQQRLRGLIGGLLLYEAARSSSGAAEASKLCNNVHKALKEDEWRTSLDLHMPGTGGSGLRLLARSLPPKLEDLKLRCRDSNIAKSDMEHLLDGLKELDYIKRVSLDLTGCKELKEEYLKSFVDGLAKNEVVV